MSRDFQYLTRDELTRLRNAVDDKRDKALILLLETTGMTIHEVCNLRFCDIVEHAIRIPKELAKNHKERIISLEHIHIKFPSTVKTKPKDYIFSTRQSRKLTERRVQQIVARYSKKALRKRISPRAFRNSFIINSFLNKIPIQKIEQTVGIKNLQPYIYNHFKNERKS